MEGKAAARGPRGRWVMPPWALRVAAFLLLGSRSATGEELVTGPAPATTLGPVRQACATFSGTTCDQCIQNTSCLWCNENSVCMDYPVRSIIPSSTLCPLSEARWGICWVNFQALIISIAVLAGVLLLTIICCCCYCCCCRGRPRGYYFPFLRARQRRLAEEEEERFIRDQEEKQQKAHQRKHERKAKHDEIRKKYGLLQDSDHPYSRYENE